MVAFATEKVLDVRHWNDTLFSFRTTRDAGLRFENGHFVMLGLPVNGKPLLRAYSIASANYEEHLEFFSIKVHDGPLTSRLQHLKPGDDIIISRKPTGTLLLHDLLPGKNLYLLSTGTGLAPFLSIIRDPQTYERFEKVVLVHGVRQISDLAYHDYIAHELPNHEFLGELVRKQLVYYPTATREPFRRANFLEDVAIARFVGLKSAGYHRALEELARRCIARMVAGMEAEIFRPDDELRRLARTAVQLGVDKHFQDGSTAHTILESLKDGGPSGRKWLEELESARHPWFNVNVGDGFYHYHRSWNDDLTLPFSALPSYIRQVKGGDSLERPVKRNGSSRSSSGSTWKRSANAGMRLRNWCDDAGKPPSSTSFGELGLPASR